MEKHEIHKTLYGEEFDINSLPKEQKILYSKIKRFYNKKPDWDAFANYWHGKVISIFESKTKKQRIKAIESALWEIAQDFESRLGIEQGYVRLPTKKELEEYNQQKK